MVPRERKPRGQEKRIEVRRAFEPNRLSQATLAQAYERIAPLNIRVMWTRPDCPKQPKEAYG